MNFQSIMSKAIEQFGNTITVINKTTTYDPVYGDEISTRTERTTVASVNAITGDEEWNKSGEFDSKDRVFFLKGTETINDGDEIILDSETYLVSQEPVTHKIGNTIQHFECRCKKLK